MNFLRCLCLSAVLSGALLVRPASAQQEIKLKFELDTLLALPGLWSLTPEQVEKAGDQEGFKESPYYQWLTSDKSGVRFSRKPYSNVTIDITYAGGTLPVDEAVVEFTNGRATRATLSLYNRGDSGAIDAAEFDRRYKTAGVHLGKILGTRPAERKPSTTTAIKISGWIWTAPAALASLECNADALKGGTPEFLRLKLAEPAARDAFAAESGQSFRSTALSKSDLPRFVKRAPNGDVYVDGVPMVDQGAKGYCVVASCQRLFGYLKIPVDQHELAQVAGSDSEAGTNSRSMEEALNKIDSRFKMNFKPLAYRLRSGGLGVPYGTRISEVDEDKFTKTIQDSTGRGLPLLWALELGKYPEEPANAAQAGGGHMRLILGVNTKDDQLLFSDSWGAGHELKRMKLTDAYNATLGLYSMEPKTH